MVAAKKLREALEYLEVVFYYEGKHAHIMPHGSEVYDIYYGEQEKHYTSLEEVMNDKFFNGKSLNEIADQLKIEYC